MARLDAMVEGARRLTRADGSLEEAFPYEGSFCVTALVASDLLAALDLMRPQLSADRQRRWQAAVRPMVGYLLGADETHALISNHLATAALALARWHAVTAEAASEAKARYLLDRILSRQSREGWFEEYGGADPGYQSLGTTYLADLHRLRPDWGLAEPLARSVRFVWHFAHPDGSFGGVYGSRCTRFYHPAGFEALAAEVPEAATLARFMASSIETGRVVTLDAIDEPNLVPMFNGYCQAAHSWANQSHAEAALPALPALRRQKWRQRFDDAGLCIDAGQRHYTIVGLHSGGTVVHFRDAGLALLDAGVVVRRGAVLGSSQSFDRGNVVRLVGDTLVVEAHIRPMPKRLPSPAQFLVLRLLCLSVMRVRRVREWVKRRLARWLIAPRNAWPATNRRQVRLGADLSIDDDTRLTPGCERIDAPGAFVAMHMASQGYWQVQDEAAPQ
jgi:hypothetical protein